MKAKRWLLFVFSPLLIVLVGSAVATGSYFTDPENSADNALVISTNYWMSGWAKRVKLTIDQNDIDSALSNFPILVYLSTSSGRNNDDVSFVFDELQSDANRKKIAVTTFDGITQCYVEIEKWDDANEEAWLWVKVPSISSSMDTDLFLYYDSTHADNTVYVGDPNSTPAENVWDGNFKLVTHMQDDPDTSHVRDSTSNNNDGTKSWWGQPAVTTNGQIDDAQDFDGFNDYIRRGSTPSLNLPTAFTISTWLYFEGNPDYEYVVVRNTSTTGDAQYGAYIRSPQTGGNWGIVINGSITDIVNRTWAMNTWTYVVWTWDGSNIRCYFNGGLDGTPVAYSGPLTNQGNWFNIGRRSASFDGNSSSGLFNGRIDEVRVSNIYRGAAWIKASYETQRDHLLDFGSEETP